MATTVQVSEETKQLLDIVKEKEGAESYDAVIRNLAVEHVKAPNSMLGSLSKRFRMTKKDKQEFSHF